MPVSTSRIEEEEHGSIAIWTDRDATTRVQSIQERSWSEGSSHLPEHFGHYRIRCLIAEGGMGRVYLAMQERPRRQVALKVMRPGVASRSALRRFEYESQILARLRHPNIAQVFEAGTHQGQGGVPFFAMEYVPHAYTLTRYARDSMLAPRKRLALFAKICDAVHHGHQKGIIHRDLKPANILVDASGEPKIIDFGVARATDSDLAATTLQSEVGKLIGTLQYMSPEQFEADPHAIDVRSDVYALGVVLYELLAEALPYDVGRSAIHEAARIVQEEPAPKLSLVDRRFRGDLETIVAKALEKDPTRRYQSSAELRDDVERFLCHEPIRARPPSISYQVRVFLRRNLVLSAAAAFGALVLVLTSLSGLVSLTIALTAGLVATSTATMLAARAKQDATRQRDEAERSRRDAENERNRARDAERESEERRQAAEAARRDAEVNEERSRRSLAFLRGMLGSINFYKTQEYDKAVLRRLYDHASAQVDTDLPDQPEVAAAVRLAIGLGYLALSEFTEADTHLQWALDQRWETRWSDPLDYAECTEAMANLRHHQSRPQEAEAFAREGLEIMRKHIGIEDPRAHGILAWLGWSLFEQGRPDEAEVPWRQILDARRAQLGEDHPLVAEAMYTLVDALIAQEHFDEAEILCRRAIEIKRARTDTHARDVGGMIDSLGWIILGLGRSAEAEALFRESLGIYEAALGEDYPASIFPARGLARALVEQRDYAEAEDLYRWMLDTFRPKLGPRHRWIASAEREYGKYLSHAGRYEEAECVLLFARETWKIVHAGSETDRWAIEFAELIADLYERWGKAEEAAQWRKRLPAA